MDIVKYPLHSISAEALLDRLEEEASELIHAIVKRRRFGVGSIHPRTGETAEARIVSEMDDLHLVIKEINHRLLVTEGDPFDLPVSRLSAEDWGGHV